MLARLFQWVVGVNPLLAFGVVSLIAAGAVWAVQEWRLRGEQLATAAVRVEQAAAAVQTAAETNRGLVGELDAADRRRVSDLEQLDRKHRQEIETLRQSGDRRRRALSQRGTDADGPVAPVVLDWLRSVRRPADAAADGPSSSRRPP